MDCRGQSAPFRFIYIKYRFLKSNIYVYLICIYKLLLYKEQPDFTEVSYYRHL